tara:strand:+ start:1182 stop:1448 length:267 start_codon:yes stop_codon:yes gene_type:complete
MPRSKNTNTYHYKVDYKNDCEYSPIFTNHFKTAKEACDFLGMSRSTFYDIAKDKLETKHFRTTKLGFNLIEVEKVNIPVYEKILISFD